MPYEPFLHVLRGALKIGAVVEHPVAPYCKESPVDALPPAQADGIEDILGMEVVCAGNGFSKLFCNLYSSDIQHERLFQVHHVSPAYGLFYLGHISGGELVAVGAD